jgi:hypothetical protein
MRTPIKKLGALHPKALRHNPFACHKYEFDKKHKSTKKTFATCRYLIFTYTIENNCNQREITVLKNVNEIPTSETSFELDELVPHIFVTGPHPMA